MWSVLLLEVGEEPINEEVESFHDAWALAQPFAEDGYVWTMLAKEEVVARFEGGAMEEIVGTARNAEGHMVAHTILRWTPPVST